MSAQLDLFALVAPPPPPPFERYEVPTRAWSHGGNITIYSDDCPMPFEVTVRGVPCVVSWSSGICTHAILPPGSLFWSDTGFWSFGWTTTDPAEIVALIEAFIDAPRKDGNGLAGQLVQWVPLSVSMWASEERWRRKADRQLVPTMVADEKRAAYWAERDAAHAEKLAELIAEGLDVFAFYPDLAQPAQGGLAL